MGEILLEDWFGTRQGTSTARLRAAAVRLAKAAVVRFSSWSPLPVAIGGKVHSTLSKAARTDLGFVVAWSSTRPGISTARRLYIQAPFSSWCPRRTALGKKPLSIPSKLARTEAIQRGIPSSTGPGISTVLPTPTEDAFFVAPSSS